MIRKIEVFANSLKVGTLALTKENRVAFQYSDQWIENGFSINPFKLPLSKEIFLATSRYFDGLFGVFADSLPDSFGNLVLNKYLNSRNVNIKELTCLDRLAYIGKSGMGMLEYVPDLSLRDDCNDLDFDVIQKECNALLSCKEVSNLKHLYLLGASSGGARPKALIKYEKEDYIIKFSSKFDPKNIAELEYKCMYLAREAGINVPNIKLVTSKNDSKYFLIKRFDRNNDKKTHMISVAALLEIDYKAPSLDYNDLIKLVLVLTKNKDDVLEMFRRMVFNVLIDNQDDHAKNFSFIYDDINKMYRLAPAYDITPGRTYYGEHTTSVNGKGKNISDDDMIKVAVNNKIDIKQARTIINKCKSVLNNKLPLL